MRAVQSSSTAGQGTSGVWGRTEQFAALRYVSRYRASDAAVGSALKESQGDLAPAERKVTWEGAGRNGPGWQSPGLDGAAHQEAVPCVGSANLAMSTVAREASALLHTMQFYTSHLADTATSSSDWSRSTEGPAWLRDRSETLIEPIPRRFRGRIGTGADRFLEKTP